MNLTTDKKIHRVIFGLVDQKNDTAKVWPVIVFVFEDETKEAIDLTIDSLKWTALKVKSSGAKVFNLNKLSPELQEIYNS